MKITIDIDCTPEEARAFMGLPNMEEAQQMFFKAMQQQYSAATKDMGSEDFVKMWTEIGQKNIQAFQSMMASQMDAHSKKSK